jgi:hypothetical protein
MHNLSIRETRDLLPSARQAFEDLLGRKLADDEEVGIWASLSHEAPAGLARKEAWDRLNQHLELTASKAAEAQVDELERLVEEVADEVRHGRK